MRLPKRRPGAERRPAPDQRQSRRKSEVHRHKEAVDAGLAAAAVVPVEDPVVSVQAGQRLPDGNAPDSSRQPSKIRRRSDGPGRVEGDGRRPARSTRLSPSPGRVSRQTNSHELPRRWRRAPIGAPGFEQSSQSPLRVAKLGSCRTLGVFLLSTHVHAVPFCRSKTHAVLSDSLIRYPAAGLFELASVSGRDHAECDGLPQGSRR